MALSHCPAWCPHSSSNLRVVANSEKKLGARPGDVDAVGQGWTRVRLWGLSPHPQLLLLPCSLTPGLSLGGLHGCPPELLPALRWGSWDSEPGHKGPSPVLPDYSILGTVFIHSTKEPDERLRNTSDINYSDPPDYRDYVIAGRWIRSRSGHTPERAGTSKSGQLHCKFRKSPLCGFSPPVAHCRCGFAVTPGGGLYGSPAVVSAPMGVHSWTRHRMTRQTQHGK